MKSGWPSAPRATIWKSGLSGAKQNRRDNEARKKAWKKVQKKGIGLMMKWSGCSVHVCICVRSGMHLCVCAYICENLLSPPAVGDERGAGCVEMGEPCHVFMLTNELITQPLIYLNLCHFTGMLQQSNACRLWVISWQLKANYYSSNSSTHQALNHKCCSLSICLFMKLLSWNVTTGLQFTHRKWTSCNFWVRWFGSWCICLSTYPSLSSLL